LGVSLESINSLEWDQIKMRCLHIFPRSFGHIIARDYIRFIREYFRREDHSFCIIGEDKNKILKNIPDIKYFSSYTTNLIEIELYFLRFDKIIFHSLSITPRIMMFFRLQPSLMNKIVWVAWGYDLYNWKTKDANLKSKIADDIGYSFRKRIKYFVGIFPPDIKLFKKDYKSDAQAFYATYVGGLYNPLFKKELNLKTLAEKIRDKDCVNIQVGHSCDPDLNHIKVLEELLKYREENIKIYLPLSYGNREFGNQVEERAKSLFGEKAVCIRELMEKDKYMDFLATIDIAIFNTHRQIALGNLSPLRYMEKKIFIPAGSVMYEHFRSQGTNICDYNKIERMDFNSFTEPVDMKKAKEIIKSNITSVSKKIEMWNKVFNSKSCYAFSKLMKIIL
jgi:dTDP-N-acetylfucosamine:lipid II N-acetylfucosaminyltransferase